MEIFSVIIQFIDFLISSVISLVNIVRYLWREILIGAAILLFALVALRILLAARKQGLFIKAVKTAAKENGVKIRFARPPFLSLLLLYDYLCAEHYGNEPHQLIECRHDTIKFVELACYNARANKQN